MSAVSAAQFHIAVLTIAVHTKHMLEPHIETVNGVGDTMQQSYDYILSVLTSTHNSTAMSTGIKMSVHGVLCRWDGSKRITLEELVARLRDLPGFSANLHSFSTTF